MSNDEKLKLATKKCSKCKTDRPLSAFTYRAITKDKLNCHCKLCVATHRRNNKLKIKSYVADHYQSNREAYKNSFLKWKNRNPEKAKAQKRFSNYMRYSSDTKQPCVVCGELKVQAHHSDYSKPLDVMWLCLPHHKAWHKVFLTEDFNQTQRGG